MTFDRRICYQPARGATFDHDPDRWSPINGFEQHRQQGPHALIELKFASVPPLWMRRLVERMGLLRVSFSKYCAAMRAAVEGSHRHDLDWDVAQHVR